MSEFDKPSLEDVIRVAITAALGQVHTSLPGVVVAYDRTTQKAQVKPVVRARYRDPNSGAIVHYELPIIPSVPVIFPSGTGWSIAGDLTPGDPVALVVSERSTDEWRATGNHDNAPRDLRRFDWSDAVAIPGWRPFVDPLPPTALAAGGLVVRCDDLRLGDATATEAVALASLVAARLAALEAAFNAHVHPVPGVTTGGGSTVSSPTAAPVTPTTTTADVAATKVKAK
jgi:hypothetical protein